MWDTESNFGLVWLPDLDSLSWGTILAANCRQCDKNGILYSRADFYTVLQAPTTARRLSVEWCQLVQQEWWWWWRGGGQHVISKLLFREQQHLRSRCRLKTACSFHVLLFIFKPNQSLIYNQADPASEIMSFRTIKNSSIHLLALKVVSQCHTVQIFSLYCKIISVYLYCVSANLIFNYWFANQALLCGDWLQVLNCTLMQTAKTT